MKRAGMGCDIGFLLGLKVTGSKGVDKLFLTVVTFNHTLRQLLDLQVPIASDHRLLNHWERRYGQDNRNSCIGAWGMGR